MNISKAIFVVLICLSINCASVENQNVQMESIESETVTESTKPEIVTLCQLQANPAAYNHKLIEITTFVSKGYIDFLLFDYACGAESFRTWVKYGGTTSDTMYCCGLTSERTRPKQLVVENISIPLLEDETFLKFDKLIQRLPSSTAHATIIGRYFSGEEFKFRNGDSAWTGHGHMGCCSLLAIQQIVSVGSQDQDDLDYEATVDEPKVTKRYGFENLNFSDKNKDFFQIQREAEEDSNETSLNNPFQVAVDALTKHTDIDAEFIVKKLRQIRKSQGRFVYLLKSQTKDESYMIVVNRPYWLSFYAKDPKKTAWIVWRAYRISRYDF